MVSNGILNCRGDGQTQCISYGDSSERSSPYSSVSADYTCARSGSPQYFDDVREKLHCRQNDSMDEDSYTQKVENRRNTRPPLTVDEEQRVSEYREYRCFVLQRKSRESRWLLKDAATVESVEQRRDCVVVCRFNPSHVLDEVDIGPHEKSCKDRAFLKRYGVRFHRRSL